jgi:HTH-type transcriptional regulator, sugar sensing transcriptional regulator
MTLANFGFTRTQDVVYKALLLRGEATGYLVARDTGLARANVYQALDVLVSRGLATTSGGRPARYLAVAAGEALARLRARVEGDLASLTEELRIPGPVAPTRKVASGQHSVDGRRELIAAAARAVDAAEHDLLAVVGPWADELAEALRRARGRGLSCRVVSLGAPAPDGAVLRAVSESELVAYWGGLPVLLVCDRTHAVCGVVSGEGAEGVDTRSPGVVPFLRHLLRRELASAAASRLS